MMAGRGGTKPRRVPPGWKGLAPCQPDAGWWREPNPNPSVSVPPARARLTPQGPPLIHVTLGTSSLRGRKSRRQFPNKDLFCNEAGLGRGHRSSLAPLSWATLVTEHRYWLNVSDHSS